MSFDLHLYFIMIVTGVGLAQVGLVIWWCRFDSPLLQPGSVILNSIDLIIERTVKKTCGLF